MNNDVNLWFAKKENEEIVVINDVNKELKEKYFCPICGSEVIARQGKEKAWHFAHEDASKCNSESYIHFWFKNKFLIPGDRFIVKSDVEKEYICKEVLVEQSYEVENGVYRPDVTIIAESGETIYFEMENTNKKKVEEYLNIWIELGNVVVEVDIKALVNSNIKKLPVFKALYYNGKCFNVKRGDSYYNIIGKYKEKLIENGEYIKRKNEVKKLDWFWRDVRKYKYNEVDIAYMTKLMDSINNKDKEIIKPILKKSNCITLLNDYEEYKENIIKQIIINFCDSTDVLYEDFIITTIKMGNVFYDFLNIEYNNRRDGFKFNFDLFKVDLDIMENKINNAIDKLKNIIEYRHILQPICDYIREKYDNGMFDINVYEGNYQSEYIYSIQTNSLDIEKVILRFDLDIDNIKYYRYKRKTWNMKSKDILYYDIFTLKNNNVVLDFINNLIENEITLCAEEFRRYQERLDKKLTKIINIFNENKKIKQIKCIYFDNSNFKKAIYFKDYRNIDFLLSDVSSEIENTKLLKENNNIDVKIINILYVSLLCNMYIIETKDSYYVSNRLDVHYEFKDYFYTNEINLSFKKFNDKYINLHRYNFIEATIQLKKILEEIDVYKNKYTQFNVGKVCVNDFITDENINNKIHKILYPLIYADNKNINKGKLNIRLNIEFTRSNSGKLKPWLINDFIEQLEEINVSNFYNII